MSVAISSFRLLAILATFLAGPLPCLALDAKLPANLVPPKASASQPLDKAAPLAEAVTEAKMAELSKALEAVSDRADKLESAMRATDKKSNELADEDRALRRRSAEVQLWQLAIQACTALVIAATVWQAARAAFLNRFNVQATAFLQLRDAFARLRPQLPLGFGSGFEEFPDTYDELYAMERYWHQSFDEWFLTQRVHPFTLGRLWKVYYRDAILKSRESPLMVAALSRAKHGSSSPVDQEFVDVVLGKVPDRTFWEHAASWVRDIFDSRGPSAAPANEARASELQSEWAAKAEALRRARDKRI